jgi:hypothetical protein
LRARLIAERAVPVASTLQGLANRRNGRLKGSVGQCRAIKAWAQTANARPLRLDMNFASAVGNGIVRATGELVKLSNVRVVLKFETYNGMPYDVLTAFPVL